MNPLFYLLLTLIISISHGEADAFEHGALHPLKGHSVAVSEPASLNIPPWAVHVPEDSFVGISSPCPSIEEARQQAIESAIGQILQAMGAEYHLTHESVLSGNLHQSRYELHERLSYTAKWLLNSIQQNIRQYAFQSVGQNHVCFVLVRVRPSELERLRRLTIGAKLSAFMVRKSGDQLFIEVRETNGVSVTLTEYSMTTTTLHSNARLITLFFWKVPELSTKNREGALPDRLFLRNNTGRTVISSKNNDDHFKSALLGSESDITVTLAGYDEIGRPVSVPVRFP